MVPFWHHSLVQIISFVQQYNVCYKRGKLYVWFTEPFLVFINCSLYIFTHVFEMATLCTAYIYIYVMSWHGLEKVSGFDECLRYMNTYVHEAPARLCFVWCILIAHLKNCVYRHVNGNRHGNALFVRPPNSPWSCFIWVLIIWFTETMST